MARCSTRWATRPSSSTAPSPSRPAPPGCAPRVQRAEPARAERPLPATRASRLWQARNPIPRIWDSKEGLHNPDVCPGPTTRAAGSPPGCLSFPAPCPWDTYTTKGLLPCGDGEEGLLGRCDNDGMSQCASDWVVGVISDHVLLPKHLPPGEYVLGWRWDAEETAQIWQNCADVSIGAA